MSKWMEIRNTFSETKKDLGNMVEGIKEIVYIDGYITDDDEEQGEVIAKIIQCDGGNVITMYNDEDAITDEYAQTVIKNTVNRLENRIDHRFKNEDLIGKVFRCFKDDNSEYSRYLCGEGAKVLEITDNEVVFKNTTEEEEVEIPIDEFVKHFELFV